MTAAVGADIEALCSKCGDVWHVVVAKDGEKIAKVQCKQCGGYHRYKSVHGATAQQKLPSNKRAPKEPRATVSERFEKPAVEADLTRPVKTYRASGKFDVSDRVDHPTFGQGVIEMSEPGKITVFFATGRRVLAQAKDGGTSDKTAASEKLTRPKPFDYSTTSAGGKPVGDS
jgi:hypothetical protein